MDLRSCLNKIFMFGALGVVGIATITYFVFSFLVNQQNTTVQREKIHHLLDGLMPLLKEEVLSDRVWAVSLRGRDFWAKHGSEGLEFGIYRPDGTPMFETEESALLKSLLSRETGSDLVFEKRDIYFANEILGRVVFVLKKDPSEQILLRRHLMIALGMVFLALVGLFLVIQYFLNRWVVQPARKLAACIPDLEKYLNDEASEPGVPVQLGIAELDRVGIALREFVIKFHDTAKNKAKIELEAERNASMVQVASQVSHDIRSPLSALTMVIGTLDGVAEESRIILRSATHRINDIANLLRQKGKKPPLAPGKSATETAAPESVMLVALLDSIVSEKRVQFRPNLGIQIHTDFARGYGLFAQIEASEFARSISNLINNSVEALSSPGEITVALYRGTRQAVITVRDNGKGIPPQVLEQLGESPMSHGKEGTQSGSGLGVYHARQTFVNAKGSFRIDSQIGRGTTITMTLPGDEPPWWFVEKIELIRGMRVVSVDDDQTIHQIWSERLKTLVAGDLIEHLAFSSIETFCRQMASLPDREILYLIDYEFLGQKGDGLDLIERLRIGKKSILVTSRFDETAVRTRAETLRIKILPKGLAPVVPIELKA